jgi:Fe-S-cluster-containing hydrogenase component 2
MQCVEICPVNALWHHWPHKEDLSDNFVFLEEERCIGCGVCAHKCPANAIEMERVRDVIPEPDLFAQWERFHREGRH